MATDDGTLVSDALDTADAPTAVPASGTGGEPAAAAGASAGDGRGVHRVADGERILVLAPLGRDAALIGGALEAAGFSVLIASSGAELLQRVEAEIAEQGAPELGTVIVTDEAMGIDWSGRLADVLERQPSWSDLPVVLLAHPQPTERDRRWAGSSEPSVVAERLTGRASVMVVDRPVRVATLVSAVRAALRTRARQLQVRQLIEALRTAQSEAERANRVKGEFLAVMSHELRTPLNAIAGYAELLVSECYGPVNEEQREALARMSRAQRHLLGLINDLLNFARVERGRLEYSIERIPLGDALTEVGPLIEPQLQAKGLSYTVQLPARDLIVAVDRDKLRQVLLNLLSNALKFTPSGGRVTVSVCAPADTASGEDVEIHITDTGLGIPPDKLEVIFDPFVQVRVNAATAREGTGLGLAISRDLARGMGGDLRASSTLGGGSTFILSLPGARA